MASTPETLQRTLDTIGKSPENKDKVKALKDFLQDEKMDLLQLESEIRQNSQKLQEMKGGLKDVVKMTYHVADVSLEKQKAEKLASHLYSTDPLENGKPELDKNFWKLTAEEAKELEGIKKELSVLKQEITEANKGDQKLDNAKITVPSGTKLDIAKLNFYKTKINNAYTGLNIEEKQNIEKMLNGIQRPDLITLLNQGKVKEFQEQIGMTTNAKDKTQKADGLFGVWTYRNVEKFVANENKKLPPKQEVKEEKKESIPSKKQEISNDIATNHPTNEVKKTEVIVNPNINTKEITTNDLKKPTIEKSELQIPNTINVEEIIKNYAKNSDGQIDKTKVSTLGMNMGTLGIPGYDLLSKNINKLLAEDIQVMREVNDKISPAEAEKTLKKFYTKKVQELSDKPLPEEVKTLKQFFSSQAEVAYNAITGAYLVKDAQKVNAKTKAYQVETDDDYGFEEGENTQELSPAEKKRVSKEVVKFYTNESLSKQERAEIRFFIRTIAGIDRRNENTQPMETIILKFLDKNVNQAVQFSKEQRQEKLPDLKITKRDARRLQKLSQLYYQVNAGEHPMMRRLFFIIQQEGGLGNTSNAFDAVASKSKENTRDLKNRAQTFEKETYPLGEKLGYAKEELAKAKAYITTVPTEKKSDQESIINAITDFDFDGFITQKDTGLKSAPQIKEIIKRFGAEQSLKNIFALANKVGKTLGVEEPISKENLLNSINAPAYLLLVQNILKNPGFDITDIVRKGENALGSYETISSEAEQSISSATKQVENLLATKGISVESGLKDLLSTSLVKLYTEYAAGLGIPLDKFIKGLSFNIGSASFSDSILDMTGINIGRNGSKEIGKNLKILGGVSGGTTLAFIPMGSAQLGIAKEFKNGKQTTSLDLRTAKILQISGHAMIVPGFVGYGASIGIDRDKWISTLEQGPKLVPELTTMFTEILTPEKGDTFKFDKSVLAAKLKEKFPKSTNKAIENAVHNISLILAQYDGLKKEHVGTAAQKIAETYSNAWINQCARDMNGKWYVAGGGLSVTFFEGIIPIIGVMNFKRHKITTANDIDAGSVEASEFSAEGNEKFNRGVARLLESINKQVEQKLVLQGDYITIPKSSELDIKINQNMKGLVKLDKDGNLIIHKETPIRFYAAYLSDRGKATLNIGDLQSSQDDLVRRESAMPEGFVTDKEINKEKLPTKIEPTTEKVNQILKKLNDKISTLPGGMIIKTTPLSFVNAEVKDNTLTLNGLEQNPIKIENISNKTKVSIIHYPNGEIKVSSTTVNDQTRFSMEYIDKVEIKKDISYNFDEIGGKTNEMINKVYDEGRKIEGTLFHQIIHKQLAKTEYTAFNQHLKESKYAEAKQDVIALINRIRATKGNGNAFEETLKNMQNTNDEYQTIKLLSAFNVFLSRTANVQVNKKGEYMYRYGGEQVEGEKVLKESEKRIQGAFVNKFTAYRPGDKSTLTQENVSKLFKKIDAARATTKIDFSKQTKVDNAISFNHGNPQDFFKLQLNPELAGVFKLGIDSLKDSTNTAFLEDLKQAYIIQLVETEAPLLNQMMNKLGIPTDKLPNKQQLIDFLSKKGLDIDDKKYIVDYNQSFGYNPECNNLVWLMENIKMTVSNMPGDKTEDKVYTVSIAGDSLSVKYDESNQQYQTKTNKFSIAGGGAIKRPEKPKDHTKPGSDGDGTKPGSDGDGTDPGSDVGGDGTDPGSDGDGTDPKPDPEPKPDPKPDPEPEPKPDGSTTQPGSDATGTPPSTDTGGEKDNGF